MADAVNATSPDLLVLALVAAPASFITGFAAAAMSFTAWNIIVPLMFAAFGLPVFQALFMSVMLDVCNGLTLTLVYGLNGKVDFRYGIWFGLYAAGVAVLLARLLGNFIDNNQDKLSSAASFVPLLIGIQFLVRGILAWRAKKKNKKLEKEAAAQRAANPASEESMETPPNLGSGYVIVDTTDKGASSPASINADVEEQATVPKKKRESREATESSPLVAADAAAADYGNAPPATTDEEEDERSEEEYDEGHTNQMSWRFWLYLFMERFRPDESILHRPMKYPGIRIALTLLVFTILGGVAGTLYAGGGMFYANIIVNAWGAKVRTAAGTGTFIMTIVMSAISFTFIGRDDMDSINNLYHLLFTIPFGIIGAVFGARLALRISDMVMYFVIVGVSLSLFVYIVVQNYLLKAPEPTATPPPAFL